MTAFTVILPHRRNPGNDRALAIALDCLFANTRADFTLLIDAAYDQPLYPRLNALVQQATTDCCFYATSDTFAAGGWDTPMLSLWTPERVVLGVVVEPGAIGVHPENVHKDFGRKPETFRRDEFEAWAASDDAPVPNGTGFIAPYLFSRSAWLEAGGLEIGLPGDDDGFTGADEALFDRWRAMGKQIVRARSFFFHLQRYSEAHEQMDAKRELQA